MEHVLIGIVIVALLVMVEALDYKLAKTQEALSRVMHCLHTEALCVEVLREKLSYDFTDEELEEAEKRLQAQADDED